MTLLKTNDRLAPLSFLTPPIGTPWSGAPVQVGATVVRDDGRVKINLDSPLFWCDPPWHRIEAISADVIARTVAQYGIVVSALRRDLAEPDRTPTFHSTHYSGGHVDDSDDACALRPLPRMVPYRPERYGLEVADFDGASIIDVRLTVARDDTGRFAFSPEQIQRWEATPDDAPLAGGGFVPAATFPPDVPSLDHLSSKLCQLRSLSSSAAVFVSMSPYRLDQELPLVVRQRPDGVILRADDVKLNGMALAAMTRRARVWLKHENVAEMPLWIVPGEITVDDAVKLIALGATGVAIDSWCNRIVDQSQEATDHSKAARMGYKSMRSAQDPVLVDLVRQTLDEPVHRFGGMLQALSTLADDERLASTDLNWAKTFGIRHLSFGIPNQ